MNFSFRRFASLCAWNLLKLGLVLAVLMGGCLLVLHEQTRSPYDWELPALQEKAEQQRAANARTAEFQTLIADVYHVEKSRFIQPELLWVTLPPGSDIQHTCQAIANVWAARSGLPWVRVESWQGSQRLAQATVQNRE